MYFGCLPDGGKINRDFMSAVVESGATNERFTLLGGIYKKNL